ncbi:MAG TPA: N-acyl homoserine lactonase family protein [Allosphingosinicella sp.]|jgi:glyoxylase-like metal-dependent hydrolase (beta-lactamase superfamily II)
MKQLALAATAFLGLTGMQAAPAPAAPAMQMWRLDCGTVAVSNLDVFSDTFAYTGQKKTLTDSCYLIRHGENYLLWDTGLPGELAGTSATSGAFTTSVRVKIVDQLRTLGVSPDRVNFVGISHAHFDHIGQLPDFPKATLLIGAEDYEYSKKGEAAARFAPWIKGGAKVEQLAGDRDVFGDGRVVILDTPGHTAGHHSLLVKLPRTGNVLLTGDLYHFTENYRTRGVPGFNDDRSQTLASMDRFNAIAKNLKAKMIIQHEPADVAKLPLFPRAAE